MLPPDHPLNDGRTADSPAVRALRGDRPPVTPVWFSAQTLAVAAEAGDADLIAASLEPERAAEHTVGAAQRFGVDAAVQLLHFAAPLRMAGIDVRIVDGEAVVGSPVRTASDVLHLRPIDPTVLAPLGDAVRRAVAELGSTPLIGVGSAPFALASLLIDGGPSTDHLRARTLMYADPHTWASLLNWCADVVGAALRVQVEAGASAAQLVDVAMGALSRREYQRRVAPHSRRAFDALRGLEAPRIHSGVGGGEMIDLLPALGADAVGVDRRQPLDEAIEQLSTRLPAPVPVLGNLDPAILGASAAVLRAHIEDVLDRGAAAPAHAVDLGGGLPTGVGLDVLTGIAEVVHGRA